MPTSRHYSIGCSHWLRSTKNGTAVVMHDLDHCYKQLGLEPGASLEDINQAYKDLAFIWHPDRIPKDNHRLQQKAQEKLKEINQARETLRSTKSCVSEQKTTPPRSQDGTGRSHYYSQSQSQSQQSRSQSHYYSQSQSQSQQSRSQSHYYSDSRDRSQSQQSSHQTKKSYGDLSGADFSGASLREKDLSGRNLSNANLSGADLSDAFLHKVNLQGANLYRANLCRANLLQSNLRGANLQEANLIGADLSGADLSGADFSKAKVGTKDRIMVKLTGAKLTGAIMPDGKIHE